MNDSADAEAICQAVPRPPMRFRTELDTDGQPHPRGVVRQREQWTPCLDTAPNVVELLGVVDPDPQLRTCQTLQAIAPASGTSPNEVNAQLGASRRLEEAAGTELPEQCSSSNLPRAATRVADIVSVPNSSTRTVSLPIFRLLSELP